eukprot:2788109-Amphidinium_carterae.1
MFARRAAHNIVFELVRITCNLPSPNMHIDSVDCTHHCNWVKHKATEPENRHTKKRMGDLCFGLSCWAPPQ